MAAVRSSRQTQAFRQACDGSSPNPGDSPRCQHVCWPGVDRCPEPVGVLVRPGWRACIQVRVPLRRPSNDGRPARCEAHRFGLALRQIDEAKADLPGLASAGPRACPDDGPRDHLGRTGSHPPKTSGEPSGDLPKEATRQFRPPLRGRAQSQKSGDADSPRRTPACLHTGKSALEEARCESSNATPADASVRTR